MMDFLYKLENYLNAVILKCGDKLLSLIPAKVKEFFGTLDQRFFKLLAFLKAVPGLLKQKLPALKAAAKNFDYRERILLPLLEAGAKYNAGRKEKAGKFKVILLSPFLMLSDWLKGLTPAQILVLLFFSGASVISGISVISSGSRLMRGHDVGRSPASEDVSYDRPVYYKKDTKHVTLTNLRLPVYLPDMNELRSVDIDFTVTMSTRESKMFLDRSELLLRDHLILEIEPSVASFPLTMEGKEIIRNKLRAELDLFLKSHKIRGHVEDIKVVYLLAN